MRGAPLLLLVVVLAAGCVSPAATTPIEPPSEARFGQLLTEAAPWTAPDGAVMDIWVYRPEAPPEERVPVIINYSPYWNNLSPPASQGGDPFSQYLISEYVPRGYAVALVAVRGTGLSDGCFSIGGTQEIDDADAIATFLAEQPWSNGNVAAVAKSYDGTVAQGLLTRNNPHVKTIVPVSPISEWYKYNYVNGVPYDFGGLVFNTYYVAEVSAAQGASAGAPSEGTYEKTPTRVCDESVAVQQAQYESAIGGDYTAYWQERNYTAQLPDRIAASVFYVHGLQDWNVKPDHMTPWIDELRARNVTVKMWLGQWGHDYPHRDDWNQTLLRWFDSELKGIPNGILDDPRVQVQDDEGKWRDEDAWPPARVAWSALYPSADGTLGDAPGSGTSMYGDAPQGMFLSSPIAGSVLFESEPFAQGLRLVGTPELTARVSATSPRATLSATLYVDDRVVNHAFLDLAHRDGLSSSEPMTPGEWYDVRVPFYPQDTVVPPGSTLSLRFSSGSPEGSLVVVAPFSAPGVVTLEHGEGTTLLLPTLALDDVRLEPRQPEDVGCWAC